jgi:hypothetical protein
VINVRPFVRHHHQAVARNLFQRQHGVLDRAFDEAYFDNAIAHSGSDLREVANL